MQLTRRDFLRNTAAGAVSVLAYPFIFDALKLVPIGTIIDLPIVNAFALGVSAGDATSERVILWTRYHGNLPIKLVVWEAVSCRTQDPIVFADMTPKGGGYVHADVSRLKPYTTYSYAFFQLERDERPVARSRIGKFKTAPEAHALVPLTIGAVSCIHHSYEPVILEHAGARRDIDLFLMLGDTSYNDGCNSLTDFQDSWAHSLRKKGSMDLRSSTSLITALDDHELFDNFDPETVEPAAMTSALCAFFENTAIRPIVDNQYRFWRSFRWGRTCEIFVLDCRTERRPSTRHGQGDQYLSRNQMNWLKQGLASSDAMFKIIINSVPIGTFPFFYESDRWEGYPSQRNEILSFIDQAEIPGVLWLSGDFHFASVGRVSAAGPGARQTEILAGPGAQLPNYLGALLNASPQFDWSSARNNYLTLSLDPRRYEVRLVYHGASEDPRKSRLNDISVIHEQILRPCESLKSGVCDWQLG